tara:strand:- start:173 stop:388 length:216 start_codon:yes stop_codon:yes gene_type:complete
MEDKYKLSDTPISEWIHGEEHSNKVNSLTLSTLLRMDNDNLFPHEVTRCLDTVYYYLLDSSAFRDKFREKK